MYFGVYCISSLKAESLVHALRCPDNCRLSSDLENLENLEISRNLRMGQKLWEFRENSERAKSGKSQGMFGDIELRTKYLKFLIAD